MTCLFLSFFLYFLFSDRLPFVLAFLTTDSSFLTAWSNDCDFESIFSRQIQGVGNDGDVLIGISTSGNSKNIIKAIKQAKYKKLKTIVFTGQTGGTIDGLADLTIKVPSNNTKLIQNLSHEGNQSGKKWLKSITENVRNIFVEEISK